MLRRTIPVRSLQQSAAYRRLVKDLPTNLVLFDAMCPLCESNVHWMLTKNFTWPDGSDKIIHVAPIASPDAKYVLSHFPHTLYRVAERINAGEPADTIVLLEKRPNAKVQSVAQSALSAKERKRAEELGEKPEKKERAGIIAEPRGANVLYQEPEFEVNVFCKSEAVFRIGQKLDDAPFRWMATLGYWGIPQWLANERYDKIAAHRFDKYGRHTKIPGKWSEEITARMWKLQNRPASIR
jgi:predicted DCC family thiol-disulfide oxidoreductase YuxK